MAKTLIGLLPLAIAVAVAGTVIAMLLSRNVAGGRWLLAAFLVGHGAVHAMFIAPRPPGAGASAGGVEYPFDSSRSWLLSGLDPSALRLLGLLLVVVVVSGFLLAGLASVGLLVPATSWPILVLVSSIASLLLLGIFLQPGLVLGVAISVTLVAVVLASAWSPSVPLAGGGAG